jgi:L-cysteate sulfo-lyase
MRKTKNSDQQFDWTTGPMRPTMQRSDCMERPWTSPVSPASGSGHFPTPLEPLENLSRTLGGPRLWIKRDDCTGLSTGGNKTRKLEFLMAEAVARQADIVITQGATQSNHARQTAAAAARLGMRCHVLLETAPAAPTRATPTTATCCSTACTAPPSNGAPAAPTCSRDGGRGRPAGRRRPPPYVIPGGGSTPLGALGYVQAALELVNQAAERSLRIDHLVHATGSAGTQAGLVAGLHGLNSPMQLLGIGVRAPREKQETMVHDLACRTWELLGTVVSCPASAWWPTATTSATATACRRRAWSKR